MAKAKTEEKMVTRSIYIEEELYERLQKASRRAGASLIIGQLVEMWLARKVKIEFEPEEGE